MKYTAEQHNRMAAGLRDLAAKESNPERRTELLMHAQSASTLAKLAEYRAGPPSTAPPTPAVHQVTRQATSSPNHLHTVGALVACLLLLIPITVAISLAWRFSGIPTPTTDLADFWMPWPFDVIFVRWLGSALLGLGAGSLSMAAALGMLRRASSDLVGYGSASVVTVLSIALALEVGFQTGNFIDRGPALLQGLGIAFGMGGVAFERSQRG